MEPLQQRKTQIATYLTHLLDSLSLKQTALKLREEAALDVQTDLHHQIQTIILRHPLSPQKQQQLEEYFSCYLRKLIRKGSIEQALSVLQNVIPTYLSDLSPFCLLFGQPTHTESQSITAFLQKMLANSCQLPEKRISTIEWESQLWFIEVLGQRVVAIDGNSNGRVVLRGEVLCQHKKMHDDIILCTTASGQDRLATGDRQGKCKVWNSRLQLVYELSRHKSKITTLCFSLQNLATFDSSGVIIVSEGVKPNFAQKNKLPHFRLKTAPYCDVKPFPRKQGILGATSSEGTWRIDLIDLNSRKCTTKVSVNARIYNLEVSPCQKMVFANLSTMTINAYSTSKFDLLFKVGGYQQNHCLMRMAVGGPQSSILAVTSEQGCVCLFSIKKKERIGKLKASSGQPVNCAKWVGDQLVFGCDGGRLQFWGSNRQIKRKAADSREESKSEVNVKTRAGSVMG